MNKFDYKNLTPFKWFVLENFPFIEADFDALTNWQLFCKIGKEINKIINSTNTLGRQVESLTDYVTNYFDNLDVQDEINNKLNEMVEQGTLQEIISDYLNSKAIFGFDNISSMKEATNLIDGSFARTLGYYSKNDGGQGIYKIREITNEDVVDNAFIIPLENTNLIAELIFNKINLSQIGCFGDGIHDDTVVIKKALDYARLHNLNITSPQNKTYLISETLNISNININLNNAKIKANAEINMLEINTQIPFTSYENIILDLNNLALSGIKITEGRKINFNNLKLLNISNIGVIYNKGYEMNFKDIHLIGSDINSIGFDLLSGDSNFTDIFMQDVVTAFQTTNVLNKFTRVHAWIGTTEYYQYSRFFNVKGKALITCEQCYCDTMRYFIDVTVQGVAPIVMVNELYSLFADWIYTDNTMESYVVHVLNKNDSGNIFISNSFIKGIKSYPIYISNLLFTGILDKNIYSYLPDMNLINTSKLTLPNTVTEVENMIYKTDNIIQIQAVVQGNTENLSSRWINLTIPDYIFKPKKTILKTAYIANTSTTHNKESLTPISLQIQGQNVNSNNISFYIPDNMTGAFTVRFNETFVKNIN